MSVYHRIPGQLSGKSWRARRSGTGLACLAHSGEQPGPVADLGLRIGDGDSLTVTQYSAHWSVDAQSPPANTAADPHSWSSPSLGPPNVSGRILPRHSAYHGPQGWRFIDAYRHPNTLVAVGVWAVGQFLQPPQSPLHAFTLFISPFQRGYTIAVACGAGRGAFI